ncbi:MAG: VanZ family protein [Nanoarchaeota archaeon]|nr:VanZ family protein [Nanoarchaeota archaeon]
MIRWLEKRRFVSFVFLFLIAIEIFYFSSRPGTAFGTGGISFIPVMYHFIVFFLLGFFMILTIKGTNKIKPKYVMISVIVSVLYAMSDEIHQLFVPLRSCSFGDLMTDSTGIFLGILIYLFSLRKEL